MELRSPAAGSAASRTAQNAAGCKHPRAEARAPPGARFADRLAAGVLSRLGFSGLVAQGYTLMAYGFLALFALPLRTYGVWRVLRSDDASGDSTV